MNKTLISKYLAPSSNWEDLSSRESGEDKERVEKNKTKLKETLLVSLQMQNLVVLGGCGTSLGAAGGPSMQRLWEEAVGKPVTQDAIKVAKMVKYSLEIQSPNIEDFLSKCEAYLQVWDDIDVKKFVNKCKGVILKECSDFLDIQKLNNHRTFLHRLSRRRVRDPRLKLFTTNYDLCFEKAAAGLGIVAIDGFSYTQPRCYDPKFFGYDIVRRSRINDDQGGYLEGVFQLYKLHGSVNWARNNDGHIEESCKPPAENACLIYPARGKYQQSFLQPHLEAVSQYFTALREPNSCLIVIGFGFNDNHLSEPILSAVHSNPHLRLIIVDKAAESLSMEGSSVNSYWKELMKLSKQGEDVWFINSSFDDFCELIPDLKSLTPAEKLMRSVQTAVEGNK